MAAVVAVGTVPVSASACEQPAGLAGFSGRPGQTVNVSIHGTLPGARYGISVNGRQVAAGSDADATPGTRASFVIPDLGHGRRTLSFAVSLVHPADGTSWSRSSQLSYLSPPSARRGPRDAAARRARRLAERRRRAILKAERRRAREERRLERAERRRRARERRRAAARRKRRAELGAAVPAAPPPPAADLSSDEFPGLGYEIAWQPLAGTAAAGLTLILLVAVRQRRRRELSTKH